MNAKKDCEKRRIVTSIVLTAVWMLLFTGCEGARQTGGEETGTIRNGREESAETAVPGRLAEEIARGNAMNGISCHDPQILPADGVYYMTGSHQVIARSDDLTEWEYIANGNHMFTNIFSGDLPAFSYTGKNDQGGYSVWASNLYHNRVMDKYLMYFCTSSTYIKSTLALAVADTPEGPYTYTDTLLYSGFEASTVEQTDLYEVLGEDASIDRYFRYGGYDNQRWPNCIDPAICEDEEGKPWMVYGSWSGGIFLLELDPATGLPIHPEEETGADPYFGYHLLGGGHHACEGPYLIYVPETDYYYLFVSFGSLEREGGYQVRQFRSREITGPYLDAAGQMMEDQEDYPNYGLKMMGNYMLPGLETAYMAPGGQSVFTGGDGEFYLVYHQRFDNGTEYHEPRVHRLYMDGNGWFVAAPFAYDGTAQEKRGYEQDDISGIFYVLDHGLDVGSTIHGALECCFTDGLISGAAEGSYTVEGGNDRICLALGGEEYSGVIAQMRDEAGNDTLCIMAEGENDHSIWAVQYR